MSAKEKGKYEDMAKVDKAHYEGEMKTYILPKREIKKKFKDPNASKRPPSAFLFCSEYHPKTKGEHQGLPIGDIAEKLGEMWNNTAADDKQPCEKEAAELKEKYGKDIAAYWAKENLMQRKRESSRVKKARKRRKRRMMRKRDEEEEEEKDEEDEENEGKNDDE